MSSKHELSAIARDAFVVLSGVREIHYRDGDKWKSSDEDDDKECEHPLVPRLRAASLMSITEDAPGQEAKSDDDSEALRQLREERRVNTSLREFVVDLEDVLHDAGMPKEVEGREVLAWLKTRLATKS